jgi:DNA polymerase III alpha subunit
VWYAFQEVVENRVDFVNEDGIEIYLLKVSAKKEKVAMELLSLMRESEDFLQLSNISSKKMHNSAEGTPHTQDEAQDDEEQDDANTRMRKLP